MIAENILNNNNPDYNLVINQLIKSLNKNDQLKIDNKEDIKNKNIFLYEFFAFEVFIPLSILKLIRQPALSIRLFDFPTQTIQGKIDEKKARIIFNQGKNSFFEFDLKKLKESLNNQKLYVMLLDLNYGEIKIIASSKVDISIFSFNNFLNYDLNLLPKAKRNVLKLFDNANLSVAELDLALLIRREYLNLKEDENNKNNEESKHSNIYISDSNFNKFNNNTNDNHFEEILNVLNHYNKGVINKEQIINEVLKMKKETGVNTNFQDKKINQGVQAELPSNLHISNNIPSGLDKSSKTYANNLKELLGGTNKDPPPLFYHNQRANPYQETIIKVINETPLNIQSNNLNNDTVNNNVSLNKKEKENIAFIKPVKQFNKPKMNLKVENAEEATNVSKIKNIKPENYKNKMKEVMIKRYNSNSNSSSLTSYNKNSNNDKFDENDDENDNNNEYTKLYNRIKKTKLKETYKSKKTEELKENNFITESQNLNLDNKILEQNKNLKLSNKSLNNKNRNFNKLEISNNINTFSINSKQIINFTEKKQSLSYNESAEIKNTENFKSINNSQKSKSNNNNYNNNHFNRIIPNKSLSSKTGLILDETIKTVFESVEKSKVKNRSFNKSLNENKKEEEEDISNNNKKHYRTNKSIEIPEEIGVTSYDYNAYGGFESDFEDSKRKLKRVSLSKNNEEQSIIEEDFNYN